MLKWLGAIFDRVCAVICALICVQFPLFVTQYTQQLTGRESELHLQVNEMRRAANFSNKTLEEFVKKFLNSLDADFVLQGEIMQSMLNRWKTIVDGLSALQNSSIPGRPFVFFTHLDGETFRSTFQHYTFGLPITWEGGFYAIIGIVIGYFLCSSVRNIFNRIFRKKDL